MISIIITIYNREKTIKAALLSCLEQNSNDYEIILVDDGSTDKSVDVISSYIDNKKIFYLHQENRGAAAAKNKGAEIARGEYILFLDSDDALFDQNVISDISDIIYTKDVDFLCYSNIMIEKDNNRFIQREKIKSGDIKKHLFESPLNYAGKPPYVFKKSFFINAGGFDEASKWGDALIFWRRFFLLRPKVFIKDSIGYLYNQDGIDSISRNRSEGFYLNALDVMSRCYKENYDVIYGISAEKKWQFIFILYAFKSKNKPIIKAYIKTFLSGRWYHIPSALLYIIRTKVIK
ncbi:glycosyltransferase [Jejubacter calystegiae]|uniref:Glycosyltransferase n=1 Tax=Jejubacter calystegiae TaxID=2579935 RepID=A0A4P8YMH2_9ENTR|nr:glycosyltransferase [Jejubacter calystegiae]QCT22029.1 glycosyltransferase [Jejubacter calystegiae]